MRENNFISIKNEFISQIKNINSNKEIIELKTKYLGKKGIISNLLKKIKEIPVEERKEYGKNVNLLKNFFSEEIEKKAKKIKEIEIFKKTEKEKIDITLPGYDNILGGLHPITKVLNEMVEIFTQIGFEVRQGPEIENNFYNFEALNIPETHPARDLHDTFFIDKDNVLRTHTSPVQIRVMQNERPPIYIIAPGKVYRKDSDISHTPMFHQIEGLWVDEKVRFSDLKGILSLFLKKFFQKDLDIRLRPSYFPFTEPSAELDISCIICNGKGCRVCKSTGWIEVMGCGMVHPNVFKSVNIDSKKFQGFAFGLGIERMTMLKYQINDIRLFFENDIRFLNQFV